MSRLFSIFNLVGMLIVAGLCVVQWSVNSAVNDRANQLERIRQEHLSQLAEKDRIIKSDQEDLNEFRSRLKLAESQLKDSESKLNSMTAGRNQLAAESQVLKGSLSKWIAAVAQRDAAIKLAGEQIVKVANERNDAIQKLGDLTSKYNKLAKDWNQQQAKE